MVALSRIIKLHLLENSSFYDSPNETSFHIRYSDKNVILKNTSNGLETTLIKHCGKTLIFDYLKGEENEMSVFWVLIVLLQG